MTCLCSSEKGLRACHFLRGQRVKDFRENSCGKNMCPCRKGWIKTLKTIVVEAVDAWKKRVYHLVHIHVRAPENGGITNGNTAEAGSGLRHSRLIRFCLRRNTGGETC